MSFKIKKKYNKTFLVCMFLLSATGVEIISVGNLIITPFYFFVIPIILKHSAKVLIQHRSPYKSYFLWGIIVIMISFFNNEIYLSSILHFCFYLLASIALIKMNKSSRSDLLYLSKIIITLNFINVITTFLMNYLGLLNTVLSRVFRIHDDFGTIRYCGFTTESSYLAMITTISMLAIVLLTEKKELKKNTLYFVQYIGMLILSKTSMGLLSILIVFIITFSKVAYEGMKKSKFCLILLTSVLGISIAWIASQLSIDSKYYNRVINVITLVWTSNNLRTFIDNLEYVDGSMWYRFGPLLHAIDDMSLFDIRSWFGHGIGANVNYYTTLINEGTSMRLGFWPSAIYDYGLIGTLTFVSIFFSKVYKLGLLFVLYIALCLTNCAYSTQAFWFIVLTGIWINREVIYLGDKRIKTKN